MFPFMLCPCFVLPSTFFLPQVLIINVVAPRSAHEAKYRSRVCKTNLGLVDGRWSGDIYIYIGMQGSLADDERGIEEGIGGRWCWKWGMWKYHLVWGG